jgi:nicotinamide mononucleotide (NMN) deamidase PncC
MLSLVLNAAVQALAWLLTVPGASRTILDARVPYSTAALMGALGGQAPGSFASAETAAAMAQEAYRSAAELAAFGADFVGVACTAALVTDRSKAGDHKV